MSGQELVRVVQGALTDELRRPPWRGDPNPLAGHCYVAAEALYHLLGGEAQHEWQPASVRVGLVVHWYLVSRYDGEVLDPTRAQFDAGGGPAGQSPRYEFGRARGFLTRKPSKRARIVLDRVNKGGNA